MPTRVLVVDDSAFFRRRVSEMLSADPRLEVVGTAVDGQDAIEKTASLRPDVITMDIEMPVMDGITAVRRIMAQQPRPILMFSSLTTDGAQATLDALEAGAVDYLPKRFEDISKDREEARRKLCDRVYALATRGHARPAPRPAAGTTPGSPRVATGAGRLRSTYPIGAAAATATPARPAPRPAFVPHRGNIKLVAIGTSTGGPVALQEVLTKLPGHFPFPLLLIQHMPGSFTPAFAQRLNQQCAVTVREAQDGDGLKPGLALLAPGGMQMILDSRGGRTVVRIIESDPRLTYKPSVDLTFGSVAKLYPGQALAVVLTGMGADGREGARLLKQGGSSVWAQDEASCVVYGMPAAVAEAGLADQILPLAEVGPALARL